MKRADMQLEVRRDRGRQIHKEVKMTGGGEGLKVRNPQTFLAFVTFLLSITDNKNAGLNV